MPRLFRRRREITRERMFETRSHAWTAAGLEVRFDAERVRRAWERMLVTIPLAVATVVGDGIARAHLERRVGEQHQSTAASLAADAGAVVIVLALGWLISRDLSRVAPAVFRRMDPATAGTVGFVVRLGAMIVTVLGAFAVGGISFKALAVGGAFTAIVVGLAAQQTLGNLFAGMVLLSARPFRVGERVRVQAGALGGQIEGVVSSLGLLYTTLARGQDRIMIPNTGVLAAVIVPLREPDIIDVKVRLGAGIRPSQVQEILDANVDTPTRREPRVLLEEIDGETVVIRIQAIPERHADGARLADEIIAALVGVTGEHRLAKRPSAARSAGSASRRRPPEK
ncbi:MAG: mechanosensitive ion channel domain-containing protein [Solirubrobacteraceae bacterium]